jgi:hypothetical protein
VAAIPTLGEQSDFEIRAKARGEYSMIRGRGGLANRANCAEGREEEKRWINYRTF